MREDAYETFYRLDFSHWFPCGRRQILRTLIEHFVPDPKSVADIGCGTGANLEMLATFGSVVGVDFFPRAIQYCRRRNFTGTLVAGLPRLPFRDGTFNLVCAIDVIEHVEDDPAAVHELLRICRPGGWLLLTVPAYQWLWSEHDVANFHKRRYTRRRLHALLSDSTVEVVRLTHFNLILSVPIIAVRLVGKWIGRLRPPTEARLDLAETPRLLNSFLLHLFAAERFLVSHINLPAGISIVCIARKHG